MAPRKGNETPLELCTTSIALGNTIAVHMLEYLTVGKNQPHGFKEVAMEFLEASRLLFPAKTGLMESQRSRTNYPTDIQHELRERLLKVNSVFHLLSQMMDKFLDQEKKQSFLKGFRMIFADTDIDKIRKSLHQCREALRMNALVYTWTQGNIPRIDPTAGIGYTALSAVLDPSSQQDRAPASSSPPQRSLPEPPIKTQQPLVFQSMLDSYPTENHSRREMPLHHDYSEEHSSNKRHSFVGRPIDAGSRSTTASHTVSLASTTSGAIPDDLSEITTITPPKQSDDFDRDEAMPKTAVRVTADPTTARRRAPYRHTGAISPASKMALISAIRQRNHKMVEQLLDSGVPPDNGPEFNLLRGAITNHDLTSVRLLLLFGADANATDKDGFTPLYTATEAGFFDAVQQLMEYGAESDISAGPNEISPFAVSLTNNRARFAQLFLKYGANPNIIMANGDTPFIQSMSKHTPRSIVELMLLYEADTDHKNRRGETALFRAINAERIDLVAILLEHGANPNLPGPKHMLWPSVHHPNILELMLKSGADIKKAPGILELATSINRYQSVDILLKYRADPNAKKDGIYTPLCTAIRDDRGSLVDVLIGAGADPNLMASEYPAFKCVTHHRAHLLPRILAAGANPNEPKGIIDVAVEHNNKEALRILLEHKVDPNVRSPAGHTALTTAIREKRLDMIDILLKHGADPAVRGQEWPISMAVKQPEILQKLLPHIEVAKINKGCLEMAVVANQLQSIKLLLAKGVDVEDKNAGVFSPLTTSIREDRKEIFYYLVDEAGADPNSPGEHLPIIKAIRRHREDDLSYIEHLITKGADINLMYRGWNAVLQALDNGDTKILKLLADTGSPDLHAQNENGQSVLEVLHERGLEEEEQILLGGRSPSPGMKQALNQLRGMVGK